MGVNASDRELSMSMKLLLRLIDLITKIPRTLPSAVKTGAPMVTEDSPEGR